MCADWFRSEWCRLVKAANHASFCNSIVFALSLYTGDCQIIKTSGIKRMKITFLAGDFCHHHVNIVGTIKTLFSAFKWHEIWLFSHTSHNSACAKMRLMFEYFKTGIYSLGCPGQVIITFGQVKIKVHLPLSSRKWIILSIFFWQVDICICKHELFLGQVWQKLNIKPWVTEYRATMSPKTCGGSQSGLYNLLLK